MTALLFGIALGVVAGAAAMFALLVQVAKRMHPYRWTCPTKGCTFTVEAADPGLVAGWADAHEHEHQGRRP